MAKMNARLISEYLRGIPITVRLSFGNPLHTVEQCCEGQAQKYTPALDLLIWHTAMMGTVIPLSVPVCADSAALRAGSTGAGA